MPPKLSNQSDAPGHLSALSQMLVAALYPPRCAGCEAFCETLFCTSCRATLQVAPPLFGARNSAPHEYSQVVPERESATENAAPLLKSYAALLFQGALREALHRFKYDGCTALAAPLAHLILETLSRSDNQIASPRAPLFNEAPLFVPIPLHAWRKWRRGYNQSELLARELARLANAPCVPLLRRTRYTTTQTELSREQRRENVRGAFALNEKTARVLAVKSAREIVLIDDVYTTGATLEAAGGVLRAAFPDAKISALTLAYQMPH